MKIVTTLLCGVLVGCSQPGTSDSTPSTTPQKRLVAPHKASDLTLENNPAVVAWRILDSQCRGDLAGGDPQSGPVCARRSKAERELAKQDICFGKKGQSEPEYQWHKCGPQSLRFGAATTKH